MTIAEVVTEATKEWGNRSDGPDLMSTVARFQREADAAFVEAAGCSCTEAIKRYVVSSSDRAFLLDKLSRGDHSFDRSCPVGLAQQIRSQP